MSIFSVLLLAVGLSMDAFAVSVCKGLAVKRLTPAVLLKAGLWFGGFQALMPAIGFYLGHWFAGYIERIDHWIAFLLLLVIGANMIREAIWGEREEANASMRAGEMLVLAVATSIDALAVGIPLGVMAVPLWTTVLLIGCVTFAFSVSGVLIGHFFGMRYERFAALTGGGILILLGLKILLEHLGRLTLPF